MEGKTCLAPLPTTPFPGQPSYTPEILPPMGLGFMELLGMQGSHGFHGFSSVFDGVSSTITSNTTTSSNSNHDKVKSKSTSCGVLEASEGLNHLLNPTTPNSSSISSASIDEQGGESMKLAKEEADQCEYEVQVQEQEDGELKKNKSTDKLLKPKKANQKKQREPRFAFMTKSEVDHLEDGYRWRKYGQKAVKNSLFPRSYYRCTAAACNVKKRVERSFNDPSTVITTYEGQHIHPSPAMARGSPGGGFFDGFLTETGFSHNGGMFNFPLQMGANANSLSSYGCLPTLNVNQISNASRNAAASNQSSHVAASLRGNGLLQDIVTSHMRVNED